MRTIVIVPTYNESENIEALVQEVLALPPVSGVIVVDDNSPDGTGQIADELAARHKVQVIHRAGKLGLGTAYVAGFRRALEMEAERIMTMDADFSHHPSYIPAIVRKSDDCDLVIGSRYVPGGGTRNWGPHRQLLSRGANTFARLMLGLRAHDCTAGFRCYHRGLLQAVDLSGILSDGYSFLIELLYRCQQAGGEIGEVPIVFEDRRAGQSKISQAEIVKALFTVLRLSAERLAGRRRWQ